MRGYDITLLCDKKIHAIMKLHTNIKRTKEMAYSQRYVSLCYLEIKPYAKSNFKVLYYNKY